MKHIIRNTIISTLALAAAACPLTATARTTLITNADQFHGTHNDPNLQKLIDGDADTFWDSYGEGENDLDQHHDNQIKGHYIQIHLDDAYLTEADRTLAEDESLVVYVKRTKYNTEAGDRNLVAYAQPTAFRILGSDVHEDESEWEVIAHAYFLYRGPETDEYSVRIRPKNGKIPKYLRFVVTANNTRTLCQHGSRVMKMAEFNIIKLKNNEDYSETWKDRFRLKNDYVNYYKDNGFSFINTVGVLDAEHNQAPNPEGNEYGDHNHYTDGRWTEDAEFWEGQKNFKMPEMSLLTSADDPLIQQGQRQRTHVTEHELYAVPGDIIALYPYYSLPTSIYYMERFSHWYDYTTGGNCDYLDFLIDPGRVMPLKDHGYIAGENVPYKRGDDTDEMVYISTANEFVEFVKKVRNGNTTLNAELTGNINLNTVVDVLYQQYQTLDRRIDPLIGSIENPYRGTFDGGGYTISNFTNSGTNRDYNTYGRNPDYVGLFRALAPGAVIKNLNVADNVLINGRHYVGLVGAVVNTDQAGNTYTGSVTLKEIVFNGEITAHGSAPGGLIGCVMNDVEVHIEDCAMRGKSTSANNFNDLPAGAPQIRDAYMFCGNLGNNASSSLLRCYAQFRADNSLNNLNGEGQGLYRKGENFTNVDKIYYIVNNDPTIINKYGPDKMKQGTQWTQGFTEDAINNNFGGATSWHVENNVVVSYHSYTEWSHPVRYYGTVASFFMPRNPNVDNEGHMQTFQQVAGKDEFVIAADFAYKFNNNANYKNIDFTNRKIYEPQINFRHIFHIKDGKQFAEDNMSTHDKNREFVKKNRRYVTARRGVPFQIRFDSPVPAETTTRSKWYYKAKADESDYRRICTMDLQVVDADTGEILQESNADNAGATKAQYFYAGEKFDGEGWRKIDGVTYYDCGGGSSYYRLLMCDAKTTQDEQHKRYIVRLIAKDINGNRILFPDADPNSTNPDDQVWVQEYYISFMGDNNASLLTEDELKQPAYSSHRPSTLEEKFGDPIDKIDYDEILPLFKDQSKRATYFKAYNSGYYFKWPLDWDDVSYAFGYADHYDYNGYIVSNDARATSHHGYFDANPDNLYDRHYYDNHEDENEKGFFFYVNAAADPGNMAYLTLDDFCTGTTLYVSAWVAEFSAATNTNANLSFNFQAIVNIKKNGIVIDQERVPIHTFVSGDVNTVGKWHHIYYSFEPEVSRLDLTEDSSTGISRELVRYELVLENNAKDSNGADYAIDDIRLYVSRPEVYTSQLTLLCDETASEVDMKIYMPFDMLLQSVGEEESITADQATTHYVYYTFLDKTEFDKLYDIEKAEGDYNAAFQPMEMPYRGGENTYGKISFSSHFLSNPAYTNAEDPSKGGAEDITGTKAYRDYDGDQHLLSFNARLSEATFRPGNDYYIVIYTPMALENADNLTPGATEFKLNEKCAKRGIFTLKTASDVIVDGNLLSEDAKAVVCANQAPVVQVKLYAKDAQGKVVPVDDFLTFDWYLGSMLDFNAEKMADGTTLREVLTTYREEYPDCDDLSIVEEIGDFSDEMLAYLKEFLAPQGEEGDRAPKLRLGGHSFAFPEMLLPADAAEAEARVVAVPNPYERPDVNFCPAPTEVRITARNKSPEMQHGIAEIAYPGYLKDVPLRIGYSQIKRVSDEEATDPAQYLYIPVRGQRFVTENVEAMTANGTDRNVYLVETDDPAYRNILEPAEGTQNGVLRAVGWLSEIVPPETPPATGLPTLRFRFFDDFEFHEGYTYRLRYNFRELEPAVTSGSTQASARASKVCDGQDVFTLKIVPEYQKWTGAQGTDWNNDYNWSRVDGALDVLDSTIGDAFVTGGTGKYKNATSRSFVPMNFTKVIIPNPENYGTDDISKTSLLNVPDLADTDNRQLTAGTWSANPGNTATVDIKYDMVSKDDAVRDVVTGTEKDENGGDAEITAQKQDVLCRPWLANECEQIHFNAGAWLGQQQYLIYEKAWVDFEFNPARWYVFSSPLQDTKASDMYMPTDGARQLTEKFQGITFNTDFYDRFAPAVFQRSWNKSGTATVYELNGSSRDVAVEAAWSHVYNDAAEAYTPGIGFSVKADVSKAENIEEDSKVLIRLPKDDESVLYYTSYDNQTLEETKTIHSGNTQYKLNDASAPIEVELNYSNGNFFMVGNPYMCYLDMAAFLSENEDVIEPSYWIMNENAQGAAIYDEENGLLYGTAELAADVLPPMQGFFVKMKENVAEADRKVRFTTDMMKGGNDVTEKLSTRAGEDSRAMIIRATDSRGNLSSALLVNRDNASKGYKAAEDAVMILDSSFASTMQVYTSAGNVAAVVNTTCDADNTPLGVVTPEGEEVTLRFENAGVFGCLRLFDAVEGTYTPLTDDIEVTVTGNCSSRYFLVSSMLEASVDRIHISIEDGEVTVVTTAEKGNLHVNVCDIAGQVMRQFTNGGQLLTFPLDKGIYIINANDGFGRQTLKAIVK